MWNMNYKWEASGRCLLLAAFQKANMLVLLSIFSLAFSAAGVSLVQGGAQAAAHKLLEGAVTDCNLTADDAALNRGVLITLSKLDNVANFCCDCAKAAHSYMHRSWFSKKSIPEGYRSIYVSGFLKRSTDSIAGYLYEKIPNIDRYTLGCSLAGRSLFNVFGLLGRKVLCLYERNDLLGF